MSLKRRSEPYKIFKILDEIMPFITISIKKEMKGIGKYSNSQFGNIAAHLRIKIVMFHCVKWWIAEQFSFLLLCIPQYSEKQNI